MNNITMYTMNNSDLNELVEPIWAFAQHHKLDMYQTRLNNRKVAWVIEMPNTAIQTMFLIAFGQAVTNAMGTYYI